MLVATWNLQGHFSGNGKDALSTFEIAKSLMFNNNIDVLCLQEVGNMTANDDIFVGFNTYEIGIESNINIGTQHRQFYVDFVYTPFGINRRCSMLTLAKSGIRDKRYNPRYFANGNGRLSLGIICDGVWVYNTHSPASGNALNYDLQIINATTNTGGSFIIAGDFNCNANTLRANVAANIYVHSVDYPTQKSGGTYDYFVSRKKCYFVDYAYLHTQQDNMIVNYTVSDHRPVIASFG